MGGGPGGVGGAPEVGNELAEAENDGSAGAVKVAWHIGHFIIVPAYWSSMINFF
jgi:hypothetical protein